MSSATAWIHTHSGLSWKELGQVLGVSRHAVHGWAGGGRTNAANDRRMEHLAEVISGIEADLDDPTPAAVRAELLRPDADGLSIVDRLRHERSSGPTWGAPYGPEYFIDAIRG